MRTLLKQAALLALPVFFLLRIALFKLAFAFGQAHGEFDTPLAVVQIQRHQGVTRTFDLANELANLLGAHEQLARACGVGVDVGGGGFQWRDVAVEQPQLTAAHDHVGFLQVSLIRAYGFDLPAFKHQTRFEALFNRVIKLRFFILGDGHEEFFCTSETEMNADRNNAGTIHATVVWATPGAPPREVAVQLPQGSTLAEAVRAAALVDVDMEMLDVGVFNRPKKTDTLLRDGDRVEIYRPLVVDPKEARRIRVEVRRRRAGQR